MTGTYLYALAPEGDEDCGPFKIGCSGCPQQRFNVYRRWSPKPLTFLGAAEATFQDEAALKRVIGADRMHHEWFAATPRTRAAVRLIAGGAAADVIVAAAQAAR
jgi:hypothetical protein